MNTANINESIIELTDDELIQMSKDIYEWKYIKNQDISNDSLLYKKWSTLKHRFGGMANFSTYVLIEVEKRFGFLVKLLLINNPENFIK